MKKYLLFLPIAAACASTSVQKLSDKTYPPKVPNCEIKVFNSTPKEKYEEIARLNARSGQSVFEGKGLDSMLGGIKQEACKVGADAVILMNVSEGGYNVIGPSDRGSASAVAVKLL